MLCRPRADVGDDFAVGDDMLNMNAVVAIAGAVGALSYSTSISADEARLPTGAKAETSVTVGGLVSIQPGGGAYTYDPYLNNGLEGTEPGFSLAVERRTPRRASLTLELSSTARMEVSQSGRLVPPAAGGPCGPFVESGCGPVLTRHSDTLLSALAGFGGAVEVKAGASVILGKPQQGQLVYDSAAVHFAATVGVDGVIPLRGRVDLVPSVRYSRALRGAAADDLGLGSNILRIGVGVRLRIAK